MDRFLHGPADRQPRGASLRRSGVRRVAAALLATLALGLGLETAAAAASVAPGATTGAVTSVEPTQAVVTGTVNPEGAPTSWYVEYSLDTDPGFGSKTPIKTVGSGTAAVDVSATLTGLSAATSYHYRLVATNRHGTTRGSAGVFNTTAAPVVITGTAHKVTASGATIDGTVNPEGLATAWHFEYGTTTSYGSTTPTEHLGAQPGPVTVSRRLSGLNPQVTYHFRLVATSSAGTTDGPDQTLTTGQPVTLNVSANEITYSKFVQLSGALTDGKAGVPVTIMAEAYDQSAFVPVAQVTSGAGGSWVFSTQTKVRTQYEASAEGGTSSVLTVSVAPIVFLSRLSNGNLRTRVAASTSFQNHVLQLQRLEKGLWVTWKHVLLGVGGRATFATALPVGRTLVRMAIGPFVPGVNQAGPGLLAGYSSPITYVRT